MEWEEFSYWYCIIFDYYPCTVFIIDIYNDDKQKKEQVLQDHRNKERIDTIVKNCANIWYIDGTNNMIEVTNVDCTQSYASAVLCQSSWATAAPVATPQPTRRQWPTAPTTKTPTSTWSDCYIVAYVFIIILFFNFNLFCMFFWLWCLEFVLRSYNF